MDEPNEWLLKEDGAMYRRLRIYEQADRIGDEIWEIVSTWDYFAKDSV